MTARKTKIVCSIGPASDNDETVRSMIAAGMNVARFNFSHGEHAWHKQAMDRVKRISRELKTHVAILLDTKGPEIRTGLTPDNQKIKFNAGDTIEVAADGMQCRPAQGTKPGHISLTWQEIAQKVHKGVRILIADGLIELDVERTEGSTVICTARNSGEIGSRKNVNLIGIHAGLPIMSEQDKADIAFGVQQNIDFIAASFVSFPEEVVQIREYLASLGSKARIIAKIENQEGIEHIDQILDESDGIMVARGDLGVQVPPEQVPLAQKLIISKCRAAGKPVITATQMLDSMIVNPRPTRAETTDVANAVFDGTDAVMLSGETAGGAWPVESVRTMAQIVTVTEQSDVYRQRMEETARAIPEKPDLGHTVTHSAVTLAGSVAARAIIAPTLHGNTARMLSRFRPKEQIIAVTPYDSIARQLMLSWGIVPYVTHVVDDSEEMIQNSIKAAMDQKAVTFADRIVVVAGIPLHSPIMANTVKVLVVGNVLARGTGFGYANGACRQVSGRIMKADSPEDARPLAGHLKSPVLVLRRITADYIPILRVVNAVISETGSDLSAGDLKDINKDLVWVTDAPDVLTTLENNLSVTVDGEQGLVYEGTI